VISLKNVERRLFWAGAWLVGLGSILAGLLYGFLHGVSFLAGGLLSAINMAAIRHTAASALMHGSRSSRVRVIVGYILRLLLIPLCFYAMMRLLFLGIIAAAAGFAAFSCGIFIEGVFEAFKSNSK
jgi:hypothetical protein